MELVAVPPAVVMVGADETVGALHKPFIAIPPKRIDNVVKNRNFIYLLFRTF